MIIGSSLDVPLVITLRFNGLNPVTSPKLRNDQSLKIKGVKFDEL